MNQYFRQLAVLVFCAALGARATAIDITPDYSMLGAVFQDMDGNLYPSAGAGRVDVTDDVKLNIETALGYWENSLLMPFSHTVKFLIFDNGDDSIVGDSGIDTIDGDSLPATSTVRFNYFSGIEYFIDPTPTDNSEFDMSFGRAMLGGGLVNNKRFGDASDADATDRWDMLTLVLHEVEHSLGISNGQASGYTKFLDLVGPIDNTMDRTLTVTSALSGLPNDFDIPVVGSSSHYIGDPDDDDTFGFTVVADPGWQLSQRALPTCVDVLGLGQVLGATMDQINCFGVPEPTASVLLTLGLVGALGCRRRR